MQKCRNDKKELFNDQPFQGDMIFFLLSRRLHVKFV